MIKLTFRRCDAQDAVSLRSTVALVHRDAYADRIASGDPFASSEAFMGRFDGHVRHPGFELVVSYAGEEPVGQAWGWPEDGAPVFSLAEMMVRKAWTGQGIARTLHDELLSARAEEQAELYVRPANVAAYSAYLKWGWRKVGEVRPDLPDAPLFDVLTLLLPLSRP